MRNLKTWLILTMLACVCCACGSKPGQIAAVSPTTAGSQISPTNVADDAPVAKVESDRYVRDLVVDSQGGVWFWGASTSDARLYRSLDGQVSSFVIGTTPDIVAPHANPVLVVDQQDVAWLGENQEIVRVDPASADVSHIQLPEAVENPTTEKVSPPLLKGQHVVVGLASHGSQLAVISSASAAINIYDSDEAAFTSALAVPAGYEPLSIGYFADGTLAVGLNSLATTHNPDTVALYPPGSATPSLVSVADSSALHPTTDGGLFVGAWHPLILTSDGTTRPLALPADVQLDPTLAGPQAYGNDGFTVAVNGSIDSYDSNGVLQARALEPANTCDGIAGPSRVGAPEQNQPPMQCFSKPVAIATQGTSVVALFQPSQAMATQPEVVAVDGSNTASSSG